MPEALMQPCAAGESVVRRSVRYTAGAVLVMIALGESAIASLMLGLQRGTPQLLYLLCSLILFAAAVVAVRERSRALLAVRVSAIAAAVMLFWSISLKSVPDITFRGHAYDLTPVLAGMLLAAVLLPRLLQLSDSDAACNCQ